MDGDWIIAAIWALTPTVLVGVLFFVVFRAVLRADRSERKARNAVEASERERFEQRYGRRDGTGRPSGDSPSA